MPKASRFGDAAVAIVVALLAGCAHDPPSPAPSAHVGTHVTSRAPRVWRVYDGDLEILDVTDRPGPLTSTAPLRPGAAPAMHPFLTATALDAGHEDQLRAILERAHDSDEFVRLLERAGFRVVAEP
jgi:hypothetical protein